MDRKVYITPKQYGVLKESEWNFHFGKEHNGKPYISDNKYQMAGRETGHFGSGTYFSTYKGEFDNRSSVVDKYSDGYGVSNPNFIEVADHIYRVDFDLYKNLYRVRSKRQGDVLYTMLADLNHMFNRITVNGNFYPNRARYDNSDLYQRIKANADGLGLRCPSYYELTRMAQRHEGVQSFSTLFMEYNGYNGVNVSGVDYYDNTKHGSVIYDLSKVNDDMEEVTPKELYSGYKDSSYDNTVVQGYGGNPRIEALKGEYIDWYNKLNDMSLSSALRLLKNYTSSGEILSYFIVSKLNEELIKRYLRILFVKKPRGRWSNPIDDEIVNGKRDKYWAELIDKCGAYYWVNYVSDNKYHSMLINLLSAFSWNIPWGVNADEERRMKEDYYNKLMSYMQRDLTDYEKQYIREDYFEENDEQQ
jgi:hypothetical protein